MALPSLECWSSGANVAGLTITTQAAGTYTVVVYDYSSGYASTGDYKLYFALAPGANEGGVLTSGGMLSGTIDLGDLDSYTFAAAVGDAIKLGAMDLGAGPFVPAIAVYDPTGALVTWTSGATMATLNFTVRAAGTFTVLVYDYSSGHASTGDYSLSFSATR